MNNRLKTLFERLKEVAPKKDGYHLELDSNSFYGGYRIDSVSNITGGADDFSGLVRLSYKEMIAWIEGYLKAKI